MNIGIAVHRYDLGEGTGGYTASLVPHLAEIHDVTLYAARIVTPPPASVSVVQVPAVMTTAYTAILSFPIALRRVLRKHELLHAQGWVASSADVVTAHYVLAAWRVLVHRHHVRTRLGERLLGRMVTAAEKRLFQSCRTIIAPSKRVRDDLSAYYGRVSDVHVVPHGFRKPPALDRNEVRRRFGLGEDDLVALWIGDARKGLRTAIEGVAACEGVHLLVATHTPAARYLARAEQLGCADRIHWAGYVAPAWPAYAAADLMLYPTIYDPFGLVVAEAMACGLPPIVSHTAGVAELVEHEKSAWLLEASTAPECARALATLVDDAQLRRSIAEGARAVAQNRPWDIVAQETVAVYEGVGRVE